MVQKTALVIGATGLVGSALLRQLLNDDRFGVVRIFVRRPSGIVHAKLEEHLIDFDQPSGWEHLVTGDVLFSALGTTLKQAGSKAAQYKIDHSYQLAFAGAASRNGVPVYVLVSSAMANEGSAIFYTRMKGELERDVKKLPFRAIYILQPGMLSGDRKEQRMGEQIGTKVIRLLNRFGIAKSQQPVPAYVVAQAMIRLSQKDGLGIETHSLLEVFRQAGVKPV
ncbi:MAG TPA: NAD(P)H-binding protein [Flavisolibacter sp.]|nr:NAD(P)H-binding protein [Flavisolibacter sp.]